MTKPKDEPPGPVSGSEPYCYRPEVLAALERHGLRPTAASDPHRVYGFLKALYTFEVRALRLRHQEKTRILGPQPLDDLRQALRELKERYPLLRMPALYWLDRGGADDAEGGEGSGRGGSDGLP